jgi:hypothetical protein
MIYRVCGIYTACNYGIFVKLRKKIEWFLPKLLILSLKSDKNQAQNLDIDLTLVDIQTRESL